MKFKFLTAFAAAFLFCVAADSNALGQGKGGGNKGGGKPAHAGQSGNHGNSGNKGSKPDSGTTDVITSGDHGKPDKGAKNADKAAKNAEKAREKAARLADKDLNRYKGLSKKLGTTPEEMRARYQAALLQNPNLTYGNFVSSHMVADNIGDRYPGVSSAAILDRMAKGRSLGQAMQDLKVEPQYSTPVINTVRGKMRNVGLELQ
jgi:hypothetical protein